MADAFVISLGYGRCLEGWQRTQEAISRRFRELRYSGASAEQLCDDLDLALLLQDRGHWEQLMRQTAKFREAGHG